MIHHFLVEWVPEIAGVIEVIGVAIILYGFGKCFVRYVNSLVKHCSYNMTICLGHSFAIGLQVLMGAEILKSILVPTTQDLMILLGIVIIRVALTLLLHYEIKVEESREGEHRGC